MVSLRFGLKHSPQRTTIDNLRAAWRIADEAGFDHCWTFDHFAAIHGDPADDVFEGWTLLAAMAEVTSNVRIGCMVTGNTYRHPAILAKTAVTVDHLSGGRLEFGLGAGWAEIEHTMLGLELGAPRERLDRFEEACQVILGLWTEERTTVEGRYYQLRDAIAEPKPVQQPHPPLWIGGSGRKRTLRITARYADAWNATGNGPEEFAELCGVLDDHCAAVGRDPAAIRRTVQLRVDEAFQADAVLAQVEAFAAVGASDVVFVAPPSAPLAGSEQLAALLPRLRTLG